MKKVGDEVDKVIRRILQKQHPMLAEVMVNWLKIAGTKFATNSYPMKVIRSKERGQKINILQIAVKNSSISMEISFYQDIILERIAVYFGFKAIHKIRILVKNEE